jgi:dynactin complex subunit
MQIITLNQIMAEYKTYESKKHLSNTYDVFLAAGPISGRLVPLLGKHFLKSKKYAFKLCWHLM